MRVGDPQSLGVQDGQGWTRARTEGMLDRLLLRCTLPSPGTSGSWAFCGPVLPGKGRGGAGRGRGRVGRGPPLLSGTAQEGHQEAGLPAGPPGAWGVSSGLVASHLCGAALESVQWLRPQGPGLAGHRPGPLPRAPLPGSGSHHQAWAPPRTPASGCGAQLGRGTKGWARPRLEVTGTGRLSWAPGSCHATDQSVGEGQVHQHV